MSREERLNILRHVDRITHEADKCAQEVTASLSSVYELILVAATNDMLVTDVRLLVHLSMSVPVEEDGKYEHGASGGSGRSGYEFSPADLDSEVHADARTKEIVRMALINLSAVIALAGTVPVVLGAGWPGVPLHEAVDHSLEDDFNRHDTSVSSGQVGELVASELYTTVDGGAIADRRDLVATDNEDMPGQYNMLVEDGILKGHMQNKFNVCLIGMTSTGNGRRESCAHLPMPRITNTYILPGKSAPQKVIESVEYSVYIPNFGDGQMDTAFGRFVFSTSEACLIKNGKVTKPVGDTVLIGSGIETTQQIPMVGNDLRLDNGVGVRGKEGQDLSVGVGQLTLKVDSLTISNTM